MPVDMGDGNKERERERKRQEKVKAVLIKHEVTNLGLSTRLLGEPVVDEKLLKLKNQHIYYDRNNKIRDMDELEYELSPKKISASAEKVLSKEKELDENDDEEAQEITSNRELKNTDDRKEMTKNPIILSNAKN